MKIHELYTQSAFILQIIEFEKMTDEDFNQAALAEKLNVAPLTVNKWIKNKSNIGLPRYKDIVHLYPFMKGRVDIGNTIEHKEAIRINLHGKIDTKRG